jgi:hypothetical protein
VVEEYESMFNRVQVFINHASPNFPGLKNMWTLCLADLYIDAAALVDKVGHAKLKMLKTSNEMRFLAMVAYKLSLIHFGHPSKEFIKNTKGPEIA